MKTLIVYGSRCGYAAECAELIREHLGDDEFVIFTHIDCQDPPTVADYDRIIIGGSLRFGKIQRKVRRFMEEYRHLLLQREVGLYLCGLAEEEVQEKHFAKVFPRDLRKHAKAVCLPGGVAELDEVNPMLRRYLTAQFPSLDRRKPERLDVFVRSLQKSGRTAPVS